MEITPKNIIHNELFGLYVSVDKSTSSSMVGLSGKVVDESRNMLMIETADGEKKLPKSSSTFKFVLPSGENVIVDGKILVLRPEDRIKKRVRR
ncbi:MAG: ribonuclease P protein component 1 [Halobacteriota archaeon]|nr:ribonuclease P protein component 1 [Halobacteriota archaeon]